MNINYIDLHLHNTDQMLIDLGFLVKHSIKCFKYTDKSFPLATISIFSYIVFSGLHRLHNSPFYPVLTFNYA